MRPDFQSSASENGCLSAEVEFVVDAAGVPEFGSQRVVRATTRAFGEAVLAMVPRLKYEPARLAGAPVRQIVTEQRSAMLATVLVPKGSPPPSGPPSSQRPPNC